MTDAAAATGILIVAHGERGGRADNRILRALRDAVAEMGRFPAIEVGALAGTPSIEDALSTLAARGCPEVVVYPFFMADGYFLGRVVPDRMANVASAPPCRFLAPLGHDPGLPAIVMSQARAAAAGAGRSPSDCRLLLVGHGSLKSSASAHATRGVLAACRAIGAFRTIEAAFLEEPPLLDDSLAPALDPTIVVGLFTGEGLHARDDVPEAIERAGSRAVYAGAVGAAPGVAALAVAALQRAVAEPC